MSNVDAFSSTEHATPNNPARVWYALFFLSGVAALCYQVVWVKKLALIFGVTAHAISTTLSVFMLGLALGSYLFGRKADQSSNPARLYCVLELAIGLSAAASLFLLDLSRTLSTHMDFGGSTSGTFLAYRLATAFLVLLPPTLFMGGTLPVLARLFVTSQAGAASRMGRLYALNVAGGVVGCLLAGFVTIPILGASGTLFTGVALNLLVAAIGYRSLGSAPAPAPAENPLPAEDTREHAAPTRAQAFAMLTAFFMAGFLGLAAEVVWTRMLLLKLESCAQAFACMLAVYLAGLAAGSAVASRWADRKEALAWYGWLQVSVGLLMLGSLFLWTELGAYGPKLGVWLGKSIGVYAIGKILNGITASLILLGLPTFLMGMAFPFAARFFARKIQSVGRTLGWACTLNTVGAMLGPLVCAFLLLPFLKLQNTLALLAVLYGISGTILLFTLPAESARWKPAALAMLIAVAVAGVALPERVIATTYAQEYGKILYYEEDQSGSVAIVENSSEIETFRQIVVGTTSMISNNYRCQRYTRLIGHVPMLLHESPRKALVICLGSGMTLSAIAAHPEVQELHCADLSRGIIHGARTYFKEYNNGVLEDPRMKLIIDDGRAHLQASRDQYDVIALEPPPPNDAGVASLYSVEFYELCRKRMNPGGIIAQWVPYHCITLEQAQSIMASMQGVFPHSTVWEFYGMNEFCILGHASDAPIPYSRIAERLALPQVQSHIRISGVRTEEDLFACFVMGPKKLSEFCAGAPLVRDDLPGLGYDLKALSELTIVTPAERMRLFFNGYFTWTSHEPPQSLISFSSEEQKTSFAAKFAPRAQAMRNHNHSLMVFTSAQAGMQFGKDVHPDYVAPIQLDPGNSYYRQAHSVGLYTETAFLLAKEARRRMNIPLAKKYLDAWEELKKLTPKPDAK